MEIFPEKIKNIRVRLGFYDILVKAHCSSDTFVSKKEVNPFLKPYSLLMLHLYPLYT